MKQLFRFCTLVAVLSFAVVVPAQMPEVHELDEQPPEFETRVVIENLFRSPVFFEKGLNLGSFAVSTYKSGSQPTPAPVTIPGDYQVKPVVVEMGWKEAAPIIRWFNRIKGGTQERHDLEVYVSHRTERRNRLHITLFNCWPSDVTLRPFGGELPVVSVTFQVQGMKCHLPPLPQTIEGAKVINP